MSSAELTPSDRALILRCAYLVRMTPESLARWRKADAALDEGLIYPPDPTADNSVTPQGKQSMNTQHTQTPWHTGDGPQARIVYAADGFAIADATVFHRKHGNTYETSKANAAHIVRCVNAHENIVELLRRAYDVISDSELKNDIDKMLHSV